MDIWKIENQPDPEDNIANNEIIENENVLTETIFQVTVSKKITKFKLMKKKIYFPRRFMEFGIPQIMIFQCICGPIQMELKF